MAEWVSARGKPDPFFKGSLTYTHCTMHRLATTDRVLLLVIMHQNREDRLLLAGPLHTVFISRELARNRSLKNMNLNCLLRPETFRHSIVTSHNELKQWGQVAACRASAHCFHFQRIGQKSLKIVQGITTQPVENYRPWFIKMIIELQQLTFTPHWPCRSGLLYFISWLLHSLEDFKV